MTDYYHSTVKIANSLLQHIFGAHVKMIRRFVENQKIHRFQQQFYHGKPGALSTAEHFHLFIRSLTAEHESTQNITDFETDIPYGHAVNRIEYSQVLIQELCLVLGKISNLHIMSQCKFSGIIRNLTHNTLYKRRLTFAILADKSNLLSTVDGQVHIMENNVLTVGFLHILADNRIITATTTANELQAQRGVVFFIHLDTFYLFKLLDATLHLHCFGSLVPEAFDKVFRILYLLLLILVSTQLLLPTLLAKHHELIIFHFIVVNASTSYFDGTCSDVVQKGTVVADKHHRIGTGGKKVLQPLDTFDIKVVGGLVKQQHIRTAKQQFGKFYTHAPTTGEFACRAVEVLAAEAQPLKRALYLGTVVGTTHHQETFIFVGEAVNQFLVILAVVVGTFGKLQVHTLNISLHLKNMLEGKFGLLHHSTLVTEYHHLGQIPDSTFAGNGNNTGSGLLNASQYLEHGGLTGTILADKSYTVFLIDNIRDVFEQRSGIKFYLQSFYRYHSVNEFIVKSCKGSDFQRYIKIKRRKCRQFLQ